MSRICLQTSFTKAIHMRDIYGNNWKVNSQTRIHEVQDGFGRWTVPPRGDHIGLPGFIWPTMAIAEKALRFILYLERKCTTYDDIQRERNSQPAQDFRAAYSNWLRSQRKQREHDHYGSNGDTSRMDSPPQNDVQASDQKHRQRTRRNRCDGLEPNQQQGADSLIRTRHEQMARQTRYVRKINDRKSQNAQNRVGTSHHQLKQHCGKPMIALWKGSRIAGWQCVGACKLYFSSRIFKKRKRPAGASGKGLYA